MPGDFGVEPYKLYKENKKEEFEKARVINDITDEQLHSFKYAD